MEQHPLLPENATLSGLSPTSIYPPSYPYPIAPPPSGRPYGAPPPDLPHEAAESALYPWKFARMDVERELNARAAAAANARMQAIAYARLQAIEDARAAAYARAIETGGRGAPLPSPYGRPQPPQPRLGVAAGSGAAAAVVLPDIRQKAAKNRSMPSSISTYTPGQKKGDDIWIPY